MSAKRLLCIIGSMDAGGAETFLMKIYRSLDRDKYQMDFYVSKQEKGFYDNEIIAMGGKVFYSTPKTKNFIKSFSGIRDTVRNGKYKYVLRISQHSLSSLDLFLAKLGGAKKLIYRSSNSSTGGGKFNILLHKLFKWLSMTIPTTKIAPSTEAAEHMFGKGCVEKGKAVIIKNAIDIDDFKFKDNKREKIHREFQINNNTFIIGHVGRFNKQKNHSFLIDIFYEVLQNNKECVLILIGKGELEHEVKKKVESLAISNNVIFAGVRSDVPDLMMAMDVFVFPSFFEGMPNTVIEAQATGLPCIISDTITKEVNITDLVKNISLKESTSQWAYCVSKHLQKNTRKNTKTDLITNGYDINKVNNEFVDIIFK